MGVYHFMGLGKSIGAVTCAVDYIDQAVDLRLRGKSNPGIDRLLGPSGGIGHEDVKGAIEAVVLFTSSELARGELQLEGGERAGSVRNELTRMLGKVWKHYDRGLGRKVFWCELDIDDIWACVERIQLVTFRFSRPGATGKEIWVNLTGGTNAVNLGLLLVGLTTGKAVRQYVLSQRKDFRKHVQVPREIGELRPDRDGYFNMLPFIPLTLEVDDPSIDVLEELEKGPMTNEELYTKIGGKRGFDRDGFVRDCLLRLHGRGFTRHDGATKITTITDAGRNVVGPHLLRLLELAGSSSSNRDFVAESLNWPWFHEDTLPD
jgi:hypothetical protein